MNDEIEIEGYVRGPGEYDPSRAIYLKMTGTIELRDYFAGKALEGILAAHAGEGVPLPEAWALAADSYRYANAMLAEREK